MPLGLAFVPPTRAALRSPLPWIVFALSMSCALIAWSLQRSEATTLGLREFELRAQRLTDSLQQKLRDIVHDLYGDAAILAPGGSTALSAWRQSVLALDLPRTFPGVEAVGFAPIEGAGAVTKLVFPSGIHDAAVGFDLLSDQTLKDALSMLAHGAQTVQFVHRAPWMQAPEPYLWIALAVRDPAGSVQPLGIEWSVVRMDRLLGSLIDAGYSHMDVELISAASSASTQVLYDSARNPDTPLAALSQAFHRSVQLDVIGPPLTLSFAADRDFLDEFTSTRSGLALGGGLTISTLHFLIAWYSASLSQRAQKLASEMSSANTRIQARLEGIFRTAMDGIISMDEHQNITLFNHAAEEIFGYAAKDILGQSLERLLPARYRDIHRQHVQRFGSTGDTARAMGSNIAIVGLRANGEEFPIDASISRLTEGEHVVYTVILRDITRRQQSEDALKRAQANLEQTNARLRQLSTHLEGTREAERIRIAREIHDDLAATLTGIKMDLSATRDGLRSEPERSELRLRSALSLIDTVIVTTRRIINDLRPSILDNLGVWAAIEWQAGETARRAGIRCETHIDTALESLDIPPEVSTALFRIVQEALSNIWRHAHARSAQVRCALREGALEVAVSDDGRGMDAAALHKAGHWGLLGMEERVRSHGGNISIDSVRGGGTSILVRIPLAT